MIGACILPDRSVLFIGVILHPRDVMFGPANASKLYDEIRGIEV